MHLEGCTPCESTLSQHNVMLPLPVPPPPLLLLLLSCRRVALPRPAPVAPLTPTRSRSPRPLLTRVTRTLCRLVAVLALRSGLPSTLRHCN